MKECLFCKNEFEPQKPKQKFCSNKCRVYFNREDTSEGGFVYCLRNPLKNNEVFYVGKTIVSLNKRLSDHLSGVDKKVTKKNSVIKSILESGEDVVIEQLEVVSEDSILETEKRLNEREKHWIEEFSTKGITNKSSNPKAEGRKTNPIGVRFDPNLLEYVISKGLATTPQGALKLYEKSYSELKENKQTGSMQNLNKLTNMIKPEEPAPTTNYSINTKQIADDEAELATLPTTGSFANQRRKFLIDRIRKLKRL